MPPEVNVCSALPLVVDTSNVPSLSKSNRYVNGSETPAGSLAETVTVTGLPAFTGPSFVTSLIVGATLLITSVVVSMSTPPPPPPSG